MAKPTPAPESVLPPIYAVRKPKVVLHSDLARLFGVATRVANQAIRRNQVRFPSDFAFQSTREEVDALKLQLAKSATSGGGSLRSQTVTSPHADEANALKRKIGSHEGNR